MYSIPGQVLVKNCGRYEIELKIGTEGLQTIFKYISSLLDAANMTLLVDKHKRINNRVQLVQF